MLKTRRTLWLTIVCSLAAATLVVMPAHAADAPASPRAPVRLQTGAGYFRDAQGRVVILHGVDLNDGGPGQSVGYPDSDLAGPYGFTRKDADFLAANGFNFMRLGINWAYLVPERPGTPGEFVVNQDYLDKIERVADLLAADHIYYMLDFHQGYFYEWPEWAIPWDVGVGTSSVGQSTDTRALPGSAVLPGGQSRAADNLFKDPDPDNPALPGGSLATIPVAEVWKDYRETWRQVAEQFRQRDYLMGYDFINEPQTSKFWQCDLAAVGCPEVDEKIQVFEENALAGIREADPVSDTDPAMNVRAGIGVFEPVSVEGTAGGATGFGNMPVTDPKVAWSAHIYCGNFAEPVPGTHACQQMLTPAFDGTAGVGGIGRNAAHLTGADATVTGAQRVAGAEPAPQLMGEFGSSPDPDVTDDTLSLADPRFVSWSYWQYKSYPDWQIGLFATAQDEQCVCLNTPSPRAEVLVRPYAQATAGTPVSYAFDRTTRSLAYTYKPAANRSVATQIVVPAYYAPTGYTITVTNGRVVSPPGALYLKVTATSDRNVSVTVTPK